MISVLCGGVGAAKFLLEARNAFNDEEIVAIVNVGDDETLHGLHISPDIDTILYTLTGLVNPNTGWGLKDETWRTMSRLEALGGQTWFRLGDQDLATHLYRTGRLNDGADLTMITQELAVAMNAGVNILPVTNESVRTTLATVDKDGNPQILSFQEYFVKHKHNIAVTSIEYSGAERAQLTPQVRAALKSSRAIIIAPSNPFLSIAPMLAIDELNSTLRARRSDTIAISPIIAGKAIKGPADRIMVELGLEPSASGVASYYKDLASTIVIDNLDSSLSKVILGLGMDVVITNTIMTSTPDGELLATKVYDLLATP